MKIALVGLGSIGTRHYRNLRRLGYRQLITCDVVPGRADVISIEDVWYQKPDVAFICTPPDSHVKLSRQAIAAGVKGLFVEKPISDNLTDVAELVEESRHIVTMCAANWRWAMPLRKVLAPSMNGHAHSVEFDVVIPGLKDALFDIAIHFIDLARWSLGPGEARVYYSDAGIVNMAIDHTGGASSRIRASTGGNAYSCRVILDGRLFWAWNGVDSRWPWGFKRNDMYVAQMKYFMSCVESGKPTGNDLGQAAETLKLALGVA